jgi:hypothetical protein
MLYTVAMSTSVIEHLSKGRFSFLRPDPAEIRSIVPRADQLLPHPQLIFQQDEGAEPLVGFPVLLGPKLAALEEALAGYLQAEEEAQFAYLGRESFDPKAFTKRWERYRRRLVRVLENVTFASHGGDFPTVFWLHHSQAVTRYVQEIPRRLRRLDLARGRDHGDAIKYKVFEKWADRVVDLNLEVARRLAAETSGEEEELFPELLTRMRDNLLIFTEDYVSPDLTELASYFQGRLGLDGRDLRRRLTSIEEWYRKNAAGDRVLRGGLIDLLGGDPDDDSRGILSYPGHLRFLSHHLTYSPEHFLSPEQIEIWEELLGKLREFEILRALRRMIVPVEVEDGTLVSRDHGTNTTWITGPSVLRLSSSTRPMDFTSTWVVNPVVHRYGLVYDITDFSATLSRLGRAEKSALEDAFRMTSGFQRRIDNLASALDLRLEKYLGDGAFYSGRHARRMLVVAIRLQRLYPEFLEQGFPFDRGLRIALNYGEYRLLPLEGGSQASGEVRYEFFGHGLVELSRLSTGKRTQEVDDFKTYLVARGYPEKAVNTFFAPMMAKNTELVSKRDESRRFYAYINQNGALINEGIVATEAFVRRLGTFPELHYVREDGLGYVTLEVEEGGEHPLRVGIRKLGVGKFKGLEPMPVYEIVDGDHWRPEDLREIPLQQLTSALERLFASTVTARSRRPAPANSTPAKSEG